MKVFISSTVFDLLDVRAVVERTLLSVGIKPMLSDSKLSAFDVTPSVNSIETCLINVRASDAFVCILDRRYGPSLLKAGFEDISATHLEYKTAITNNIPVHFFVRDRLEADYITWKKNGRNNSIELPWVIDKEVFSLLLEHRELQAKSHKSNWFSTFTNATDLSDALSHRFDQAIKPQLVLEAIRDNRFPLLSCTFNAEQRSVGTLNQLYLTFKCSNVSQAVAFSVQIAWPDDPHAVDTLAPGQSLSSNFLAEFTDLSGEVTVSYETMFGVRVLEVHKFGAKKPRGNSRQFTFGSSMASRRFIRSSVPNINIE